jgi:hypothetical protein
MLETDSEQSLAMYDHVKEKDGRDAPHPACRSKDWM